MKKLMNVVSFGPMPSLYNAVTSKVIFVPFAMLFVIGGVLVTAPWSKFNPAFQKLPLAFEQSCASLAISLSIAQFHVTPWPFPRGLFLIGKLLPLPSGGVFVGFGNPEPQRSQPSFKRIAVSVPPLAGQPLGASGQKFRSPGVLHTV